MRNMVLQCTPFPYYPDETYFVRLYKINGQKSDQQLLAAYRNGEPLGYGFKFKKSR